MTKFREAQEITDLLVSTMGAQQNPLGTCENYWGFRTIPEDPFIWSPMCVHKRKEGRMNTEQMCIISSYMILIPRRNENCSFI